MLDLQRQRSSYQNKESAFFARGLLIAHVAVGLAVVPMLVFQERFPVAISILGWYLCSFLLAAGMGKRMQWARWGLGVWFFAGAVAAFVYLTWVLPPVTLPTSPDEAAPPLGLRLLPLWLSTVALAYVFGAGMLMFSRRLSRATERGFALWDAPRLE